MQILRTGLVRWSKKVLLGLVLTLGLAFGLAAPAAGAQPGTAAAYHLPPDKEAKARTLGSIRTAIHFGGELWGLAVLVLLLSTRTAARMGQWAAGKTSKGWLHGLIFSVLLAGVMYLVAELPVEVIGHAFSLRYGISVQGWGSWLLDALKSMSLVVPLEGATLMLVFGLLHWGWSRRRYWVWLWVGAVPIMVLGAFIEPQVFEPMFNNFEPLTQTHPALVHELERVVARTGTSIPPQRMFLMKASEKSNGLNAYVSGIGATKRVVVWDTTADRMPVDEILFTFGHESGHYVLNHIPKGLTLAALGMFALFWATAGLAGWLVRRFGGKWGVGAVASLPGLAVMLLAFTALQGVIEPVQCGISRYFEHQADVYGQEAMHGIVADPQKTAVAAFNDLGAAYLDDPDPSPFVESWTYDHPSLKNRAAFAAQYDPWAPGQAPEFFAK